MKNHSAAITIMGAKLTRREAMITLRILPVMLT